MSKLQIISDKNKKSSSIKNLLLNKIKSNHFKKSKKVKKASKKEIQSMINLCLNNLNEINFFKPKEKKPIMLENLRNIFYIMELSDKELSLIHI